MSEYDFEIQIAEELKADLILGQESIPGAAQHGLDLKCWEQFFDQLTDRISVVELGTGSGTFSKWLVEKDQVKRLVTTDIEYPSQSIITNKGGFFGPLDVFEDSHIIKMWIEAMKRPFILYCDNGDKAREVAMFSPYLRVGDFLAVHDYGTEIFKEDIPSNFELVEEEGLTRIYRKINND